MSSSHKYKVLFLSSWYPSRVFPFQGDFVKRHASSIALFTHVMVLHVVPERYQTDSCDMELNIAANFTELIIYFKPRCRIFRPIQYLHHYLRGTKYLINHYGKPDIIHSNVLIKLLIIPYLISRMHHVPFVISEHWTGFLSGAYNKLSLFKKMLLKFTARKSSCMVPVTHNLKKNMLQCGLKGRYRVIPNVVDVGIFKPQNNEVRQTVKHIIHVSNLRDAHKNILGLVRVLKKLLNKRDDFVLDIIHSESNPDLEHYLEKNKLLNNYIFLHGSKSGTEVADFLSKSAFLVLFSNYENLPCVIIEALASGIPVVSTDVGGISEHVNAERGVLLKPGDESELFDKMDEMLDRYDTFDKENLSRYAKEKFSEENIAMEFMKLYKEIMISQ